MVFKEDSLACSLLFLAADSQASSLCGSRFLSSTLQDSLGRPGTGKLQLPCRF